MLKPLGCTVVEFGHAGRRDARFNETDEITANRAEAVVRNDLIPLICIGEKLKSIVMSRGAGLAIQECVPQVLERTSTLNTEPRGCTSNKRFD